LSDSTARARQQAEIASLAATLASPGATQRAAQALIEELNWPVRERTRSAA
jgi:hypothetical protein